MKRWSLAIAWLASNFLSSSVILAEPAEHDHAICEKLETVIHDPQIGVHLETRTDGFVLRMKSKQPESQSAARAFAVEVMKQHDLAVEIPQTNGYGLPEQ